MTIIFSSEVDSTVSGSLFDQREAMAFPGYNYYDLVIIRKYCMALCAALARESSRVTPEP